MSGLQEACEIFLEKRGSYIAGEGYPDELPQPDFDDDGNEDDEDESDFPKGDALPDFYEIHIWPAKAEPTKVIKQFKFKES
jgi:hypothetical protein